MVRAFASNHCGLGLVPGLCIVYRLSLWLVLVLALKVFFFFFFFLGGGGGGTPVFPPSSKTNISKFQFDRTGLSVTHNC